MPHLWWESTLTKAESLEKNIIGKQSIVKTVDKLADEFYFDSPRELYYDVPFFIRKMIENPSDFGFTPLSNRMKEYSEFSNKENSTQRTMEILRNRLVTKLNNKEFINSYTNYFRRDNPYQQAFQELPEEHHETVRSMKTFFDSIFEYIKLLNKMNKYIESLDDRMKIRLSNAYSYMDKVTQPPSNDEEVLYHATPYAQEIIREGFKTKKELGNREVLGGDTQDAISFTADFKIAKEIALAIREAILIAKGKLGINEIIKRMKQENIPIPKDWVMDMRYRKFSDFALTKDMKQQAFQLYRQYLTNSKLRYDPLFFGVNYKNFESLDENNVAVIACRCNMKNIVRYLQSMEEFRVPIKDIKILKMIKI